MGKFRVVGAVKLVLDYEKGVVKVAQIEQIMRDATLEVLQEAADQMVYVAKSLVPVDTGSLQKSIRKERSGDSISVRAGGYVTNPKTGKIVDYAVHIELSQPFMAPAYDTVKTGLVEKIQQRVKERVES